MINTLSIDYQIKVIAVNTSISVVFLTIGLIVFLSNPHRKLNRAYLLSILSIILWLAIRDASSIKEDLESIWLDRLSVAASPLMAVAFYYFSKYLLKLPRNLKLDLLIVIPACITLVLSLATSLFVKNVYLTNNIDFVIQVGTFYYLNTFYIFSVISYCIYQIFRHLVLANSKDKRNRYITILFGIGIALLVNVFSDIYFIMIRGQSNTLIHSIISAIGLTCYATFVAYAIAKQGLFSIRRAIASTLAHTILIGLLLLIYGIIIVLLTRKTFGRSGDNFEFISTLIAVTLVTFTIPLIKKNIEIYMNKIFFQDAYDYKKALNELSESLAKEYELSKIMKSGLRILNSTFKPVFGALVVYKNDEKIKFSDIGKKIQLTDKNLCIEGKRISYNKPLIFTEDFDAKINSKLKMQLPDLEIIFKLELRDNLTGYLLLGNKLNGRDYDNRDLELLRVMVKNLGVAISNSLHYESVKQFADVLKINVLDATKSLRESNRKLEQISDTKDEFISMASHQLLPQLSANKGFIEMLKSSPYDSGEILALMNASNFRMTSLVSDMLNVSKIQSGKLKIDLEEVDIVRLLDEEIANMHFSVLVNNIKIKRNTPKKVLIIADSLKLREAIYNLLDNAIQYSFQNSSVDVNLSEAGNIYKLEIIDRGIGISEDDKKKLFTKYFRSSNARDKRPTGTGIGLFVAKKIIEAHDFKIDIDSKLGAGTTFIITIPKPQ